MKKVILLGEPLELFRAESGSLSEAERFTVSAAGAELNVAVGLARLGLHPVYVTMVGSDAGGDRILSFMRKHGIDSSLTAEDNYHQTSVLMRSGGEVRRLTENPAVSFISAFVLDKIDFSEVSAVCFSGSFPTLCDNTAQAALHITELAGAAGVPVVFDPNLRGAPKNSQKAIDIINNFAAKADIFLPSLNEAKVLCGLDDPKEIAEHYLSKGTRKTVIKLGKRGAYYKSAVESGIAPTFRADEVVDEEGAGDGFTAGLISGICEEIPLGEAVVRANAVGCMQIQCRGAHDGLPTMEQLREYMLDHRFVVEGCKEF